MWVIEPPPASSNHRTTFQVARTAAIMSTDQPDAQPPSSSVTPKPDVLFTNAVTLPSASRLESRKAENDSSFDTSHTCE